MLDSKFAEYPKGPKDHDGIVKYANAVSPRDSGWRHRLEMNAMTNILNYLGIQWLTYEDSIRAIRPLGSTKRRTARPVTNRIQPLVNTTKSRLLSFKPEITIRPGGLDADDVTAATVGESILKVIDRETGIEDAKGQACMWLLLTGNLWVINNYDVSPETGQEFIPFDQCTNCQQILSPLQLNETQGKCPNCGGMEFIPAIEPTTQEPLGVWLARGKMSVDIENIFTTRYDPEAKSVDDSEFFMVDKLVPREWAIRTYGAKKAEKIKDESYGSVTDFYLQSLAYTAGNSRFLGLGQSGRQSPKVRLRRLWLKPRHDKAPKGIYSVICGEEVMESMPYPYHKKNGDPFLNVVHFTFDDIPGTHIGRSRCDDLIPKQYERNLVEAHILIHTKRMAATQWLIPQGMGISTITGEGGQYLRYNAIQGVPPPTKSLGAPIPPYFMAWIERLDQEMDALWGTYEIARGEAPRGVEAYAALSMLDERAQQAQAALFDNWAKGWMRVARQNLDIWREYADEERTINIAGGRWAASKFNNADILGGIDIDVDLGRNKPRTLIALRSSLAQAHQMSLLNPADPQERFRALQLLGLPEVMQDYKLDYEQANMENDQTLTNSEAMLAQALEMIKPLGPPMVWENHMVHLTVHRQFIVTEKFRMLDPIIQQEFVAHMSAHFALIQPPEQTGPKPKDVAPTERDINMDDAQKNSPNTADETFGGGGETA